MSESSEPREYTQEEVADIFLAHINNLVSYWYFAVTDRNCLDRLNGLAFSILATIDGSSGDLPAFSLRPAPHESDKEYHKEVLGTNWWPEETVDISGSLHERWHDAGWHVNPIADLVRQRDEAETVYRATENGRRRVEIENARLLQEIDSLRREIDNLNAAFDVSGRAIDLLIEVVGFLKDEARLEDGVENGV